MPFTLPNLSYGFDALEPHIDAKTMEIHHGKHHQAYVTNANKALENTRWSDAPGELVIRQLAEIPDEKRTAVRNNAGGPVNHSMFLQIMAPAAERGRGGTRRGLSGW